MREYFVNIILGIKSFWTGMSLTLKHLKNKEDLVATLQYPNEKWPIPERNIGYDHADYNVIRSRLHVDMDDCIGCLQCERACPVDCIKIDVLKTPKDSDFDCGITSHGTQKKLLVPRFTIDMSECMYCNLCVYPCPEECIYMVGGPNEDKHEIDYEFSEYTRDGLIYEFATATDEDIMAVNGQTYIDKRNEKIDLIAIGRDLQGVDQKDDKNDSMKKDKPEVSTKANKPDFSVVNEIEDRVTRATAKKAFTLKFKEGASFQEIADHVKKALTEADKFTPELESTIKRIGEMQTESATDVPVDATPMLTPKVFNTLEDKMLRGMIKKIFISEKKKGSLDIQILKSIRAELKKEDLLGDDISSLLKDLMLKYMPKPKEKSVDSEIFDIKMLNDIDDKMSRGMAKKIYTKGKRDKKKSAEIIEDIKTGLIDMGKLTDDIVNLLDEIKEGGKQ